MGSNRYDGLDLSTVKYIKKKAGQLIGRAGLVEGDREDLEQELVLDLLVRIPQYDPTKSSRNTFIRQLVEHKIASLLKFLEAGCRDYRCSAGSLDEHDGTCDGNETPPVLNEPSYRHDCLLAAQREEELQCLQQDIAKILATVPPHLQDLCVQLQQFTISEVSRETKISRDQLYQSIMKLRIYFKSMSQKQGCGQKNADTFCRAPVDKN